jgi:hypothetical protein
MAATVNRQVTSRLFATRSEGGRLARPSRNKLAGETPTLPDKPSDGPAQ